MTIVKQEDCPRCEIAIKEFSNDGHDVEIVNDLQEITDKKRRREMMSDVQMAGGSDMFPMVFIYDRFVPWEPKAMKGAA